MVSALKIPYKYLNRYEITDQIMAPQNTVRSKKLIFWSIVILFFYALGLRLTYVETAFIILPIRRDAKQYVTIAENLVAHNGYSSQKKPPFHPNTFITPGYPLFLASIFKTTSDFVTSYVVIQRLQSLLSAATVVLVFLIGLEFLPLWGAFLAGCFMVISPHAVIMSGYLLTETFFTFLLYLAIYCAIKGLKNCGIRYFAGFGLIAGAASLVRPVLLLFPVLVTILLWQHLQGRKAKIKACCIMLLAFILLQTPWFIWKNSHTSKEAASPSATSLALGTYPDLIYKDPELRGKPYKEDPEYDRMIRSSMVTIRVLIQRAKTDPLRYIKWYLVEKPYMFWSWETIVGTGGPYIYQVASSIYTMFDTVQYTMLFSKWTHPLFLLSSSLLILYMLWSILRNRSRSYCSGPGIQIVAMLALYFTAIHAVLAPLPRYSIPVHGCLYLLGTCGFAFLIETLKTNLFPRQSA